MIGEEMTVSWSDDDAVNEMAMDEHRRNGLDDSID